MTAHDGRRVAPFGNPGITACVRLPQDYRGLPRPSSPVRAKASTVRPYFAWPDSLRPHSKAAPVRGLTPGQEHTRRTQHSLVLSLTSTLVPHPCCQCKLGRGVLCVSQPQTRGGRLRDAFESRRTLLACSKGGDPAAGSPTATLLRLRPSHRARLRRLPPVRTSLTGWVTDFGRSRLPWRDGRCVQGPGTYSPWCS